MSLTNNKYGDWSDSRFIYDDWSDVKDKFPPVIKPGDDCCQCSSTHVTKDEMEKQISDAIKAYEVYDIQKEQKIVEDTSNNYVKTETVDKTINEKVMEEINSESFNQKTTEVVENIIKNSTLGKLDAEIDEGEYPEFDEITTYGGVNADNVEIDKVG